MSKNLKDSFNRKIKYLRLSVTDRCDYRCFYCMPESEKFIDRSQILSFEEIYDICECFTEFGVEKIRITGGEPLTKKHVLVLVEMLSKLLEEGRLTELTMTSNGSQLKKYASSLKSLGINRINLSLDSLIHDKFYEITKGGNLSDVLDGVDEALKCGIKLKLNVVAIKGVNDDEFENIVLWAHDKGIDVTFIETMPLGRIGLDRSKYYINLDNLLSDFRLKYQLESSSFKTNGPSQYYNLIETGGKVGFITPMSNHFCESCNRVRLTCNGELYTCLGQEDKFNLKDVLRNQGKAALLDAIKNAISIKPKGHNFEIFEGKDEKYLKRVMAKTGG